MNKCQLSHLRQVGILYQTSSAAVHLRAKRPAQQRKAHTSRAALDAYERAKVGEAANVFSRIITMPKAQEICTVTAYGEKYSNWKTGELISVLAMIYSCR